MNRLSYSSPSDRFAAAGGAVKPVDFLSDSSSPQAAGIDPETGEKLPSWPRPKLVVPSQKKGMSHKQIGVLIRHARRAYDIANQAGLTALSFDEWRHIQVANACGCDGLTVAQNRHFRAILAHFLLLCGDAAGVAVSLRTGTQNPGGYAGETVEDREQAIWLVREHIRKSGTHENYVLGIARNQYKVGALNQLNAAQAMAILFTLRRRGK